MYKMKWFEQTFQETQSIVIGVRTEILSLCHYDEDLSINELPNEAISIN